ncbi:biopolymer transporter ExbD [Szabonella alba]|uniref:Biopolymer transporter ExbD n=1 Tax=Szabonella alba TaxID=2804194 RepID=A0A8K0VD28_9RHOB|nr:biopolymer transporter ExbD [Szabonella alba]MBL4916915.1 biopolymer transporter ExbD [Szabonella alba]
MADRAVPFRRRRLSVTSLIDVIFLLLLFFMLTTTFTRTGDLPLSAAGTGAAVSTEAPVFLRLDPEALSVNAEAAELEGVVQRIRDLSPETGARVLVSLGPGVHAQRLADLLMRLRGLPGAQVQVLE